VKLDIQQSGNSTTVNLEHSGFPEGGREQLEGG
jgi:hypothetical protein